jgi:T5SS/PEP-CTERM-associated repeat protein
LSVFDISEYDYIIGQTGKGTLEVMSNGGSVKSKSGIIGQESGSEGKATISGSGRYWNTSGNITVGSGGKGTLIVQGNGDIQSTDLVIGSQSGSDGTVTITGTGSTYTSIKNVMIGKEGSGILNVSSLGQLNSKSGEIGSETGGVGSVTIGSNGVWTSSGEVVIGVKGTGSYLIA